MRAEAQIEIVAASAATIGVVALHGVRANLRRRWMRGHPAPTFVFADLAGYTALTERHGDAVAARIAHDFRRTIRRLSRTHGAWHVKSMGDGVMIWAPDAGRAVALAAHVVDDVGTRADMLPVRVGVHTGPAVMSGWDWYGGAVNLAARLASAAYPNEALISSATRLAVPVELTDRFVHRRELALRGVERPIVAWRLILREVEIEEPVPDPGPRHRRWAPVDDHC
jgi:class 3 adenylate cyclase